MKLNVSCKNLHWTLRCITHNCLKRSTPFQKQISFVHFTRQIHATSSSASSRWQIRENRFRAVHVTLIEEDYNWDAAEFHQTLQDSIKAWQENQKRSVFLKIPITHSHLISAAAQLGFTFHHARGDYSMLTLWIDNSTNSTLPAFANHTVGASGICVNEETNEALVVQDKGKMQMWKFPGGYSEPGESIGETAVRECREETGVESTFQSILTLRQSHGRQFGQSDFYFICRLQPKTFEITPCQVEIERAEWVSLTDLLHSDDSSPLTRLVCKMVLHGQQHGYENVDISGSMMKSWVKGYDDFFLYHRPLTE